MNTRKFLEIIWPPSGPYCIATPWITPEGKKTYAHKGCDTIDDAIVFIATKKQTIDLYFALHTLKVVRTPNPKTGKLQTFRTHENMRKSRVFFFDIDVGEDKPYATQAEALGALERFLFLTGLPSPFVTSSGYGVHVYWPIDTPIESMAWRDPASQLFRLAQSVGLHVDHMRTTDQSSVLRVPNTFNFKDPSTPRKVVILAEGVVTPTEDFLKLLEAMAPAPAATGAGKGKSTPGPFSVAWDGRYPPADEVADVCKHIRQFRDNQGNISEPLWHVGIGVIKYCDGGETVAHEWSKGHPDYSQEETQGKLDAWVTPPPGCEKIDHNSGDPSVCARCPHKDLAKNPLLIANIVYEKTHQPAPITPPTVALVGDPIPPCPPPSPYIMDAFGVRIKKEGLVCDVLMFPFQWVKATNNEAFVSRWYIKMPLEGWKIIELGDADFDIKKLASALRNRNIVILPKQLKGVHTYMLSYLKELKKTVHDLHQYDYMGFETPPRGPTETDKPLTIDNPEWFILYGKKISTKTGEVVPCVMTKNTSLDCMGQVGTLAQQIALMEFYNRPEYTAQQFALGCSLATPFFHYLGLHGTLVCLTGETGASKSTGTGFAASIWGNPELYPISALKTNSTDKARQEHGAIFRNLPFMCDEITRFDPDTAHEIALSASQLGTYKSLKANREFRDGRGGYKANITICNSNRSLVSLVSADSAGGQAGIMRIFEIKISRNTARTKAEADDAWRLLKQNYGWIGEDFLRRCLPHREAISKKLIAIQRKLEADINASQEERFMTAVAATALLGIWLGCKLGYFPFDYAAVREWLVNVQIPAMRNIAKIEREHVSSETILNEYLEEISPHMCRIDVNSRGVTDVLYMPPYVDIKARYEIANLKVFVRTGPFRDYCVKNKHDHMSVMDQLMADGLISNKRVKKRMKSEAKDFSNPVQCFVIPVKSTSPITVPGAPDNKVVDIKTGVAVSPVSSSPSVAPHACLMPE